MANMHFVLSRLLRRPAIVLAIAAATVFSPRHSLVNGHETDQFSVPVGKELVDLGELWNRLLFEALRQSVDSANAEIEAAEEIPISEVRSLRLASLQSPDHIAHKFRSQFPLGLLMIDDFERKLRREQERRELEDKLLLYRSTGDRAIYERGPVLPDPRILTRSFLLRSSTLKIHGCCLGSDKLGHFIEWGHLYYLKYRVARRLGVDSRRSLHEATAIGKVNPFGEILLHGFLPTGVYSNADLAANFVGMKFYVNLSEPVTLQGETCPPMLERDGPYWKLASHVRPDGRFFSLFISDHFDEALNPCLYDWTMRDAVREGIRANRQELLRWYAAGRPERMTRRWFDDTWLRLRTYYGEDYGQFGDYDDLPTIGAVCFPDQPPSPEFLAIANKPPSTGAKPASARPFRDVRLQVRAEGPARSGLQRSLEYRIDIVNVGTAEARDLEIELQPAEGLVPTTLDSMAQYDPQRGTILWRTPRLPAGKTHVLRYKASTVEAGEQVQSVAVSEGKTVLASAQLTTEVASSLQRR